jgi:ferredoxin, 2Fe-2S
MPKVTFITQEGKSVEIENADGCLVEVAVEEEVEGIAGDCGGACSCSTCHVYVPKEWMDRVGPANETEKDTLSFNSHCQPNSRLTCQIEMTDELDDLVLQVAPND